MFSQQVKINSHRGPHSVLGPRDEGERQLLLRPGHFQVTPVILTVGLI